jgi:hypothetical protein
MDAMGRLLGAQLADPDAGVTISAISRMARPRRCPSDSPWRRGLQLPNFRVSPDDTSVLSLMNAERRTHSVLTYWIYRLALTWRTSKGGFQAPEPPTAGCLLHAMRGQEDNMGKSRTEITRFNFPEVSDQEKDFFVDEVADVDARVEEELNTQDSAQFAASTL